jgi:hypothetical protein
VRDAVIVGHLADGGRGWVGLTQSGVDPVHHTHHHAAAVYATLGDGARAVQILSQPANAGMPNFPSFLQDRHFAVLRERGDFQKLLAELKRRWELFKAEFGEA